jgi:actin related protein 2/3 complex subunit 1A/1B
MSEVSQLVQSITCHAWNADQSKLAVCPNNNTVIVYAKQGNDFVQEHVLKEHDQIVTGIDWAPKSNRIVTCGQDRNAYVWRFEEGTWKPTLVILRINRAATDVKWSPLEDKFAVASGACSVSVCYFEKDNDWWVSKHIKKHNSTVLKVDWHPNNVLLATCSSDNTCRVVSGFVRGIDKKPGETAYGSRLPFGEQLAEYPSAGWIHSVKWSPAGDNLAWVSHDATVTILECASGTPTVLRLRELPLVDIVWVNPTTLVGAGHNFFPRTFVKSPQGWQVGKNLDEQKAEAGNKATGTRAAFQNFQNRVETGEETTQTKLQTKHQNFVNNIQGSAGTRGAFTSVSTTSLDGKLVRWKL